VIGQVLYRSDHRLASYPETRPLSLSPESVIGNCDSRNAVVVQDRFSFGPEIRFFDRGSIVIAAVSEFCIAMLLVQRLTIGPEIRRFDLLTMAVPDSAGSVDIDYENDDYVATVHLNPKLEDDEDTFALQLLCDYLVCDAWIAEGRDPAELERLRTLVM
jgi:hypothetical protein